MAKPRGPMESRYLGLDREWMTKAKCIGAPWDIFFPAHSAHAGKAKRVCQRCPVVDRCLHYAMQIMAYDTDAGVWGGKSEADRKKMRRAVAMGWLVMVDPDDDEFGEAA